jgi:hypothetical protein
MAMRSCRVLLTGALITAAIGLAAPAGARITVFGERGDADPIAYSTELAYTGVGGTTAQALNLAATVCAQRAAGYSEDSLIRTLDGPATPWTAEQAVETVMGAEYHFCPTAESTYTAAPDSPMALR